MPISIDWGTKVITVPQSYLTSLGGDVYELDIDQFRLDLKDLEDSEEGMPHLDTHTHNTEVSLGGITLSRVIEIVNGYTVTFEDGQYAVNLVGANSNIGDMSVLNVNQVSVRSFNSAGLITVVSGSGVTDQDKLDIADRVWDEMIADHGDSGSTGESLDLAASGSSLTYGGVADAVLEEAVSDHISVSGSLADVLADVQDQFENRLEINEATSELWLYDDAGTTVIKKWPITDKDDGAVVLQGTGPANRKKRTL